MNSGHLLSSVRDILMATYHSFSYIIMNSLPVPSYHLITQLLTFRVSFIRNEKQTQTVVPTFADRFDTDATTKPFNFSLQTEASIKLITVRAGPVYRGKFFFVKALYRGHFTHDHCG